MAEHTENIPNASASYQIDQIEKLKQDGKLEESKLLYDKLIAEFNEENYSGRKEMLAKHCESKLEVLALMYNNRGHTKYLQVDFAGAIIDYTRCIEINPKNSQAYYNRGLIKYRMGYFEDAQVDMNEALKLNPSFQDANLCLQQCYVEMKNKSTER